MTISPPRKPFIFILILIALAAAIPRLILGASQFIEYDGYWHVFIAQQDNWDNFWADIKVNAHPPLYFLLLKFIIHFGRSLLVYRSISLFTGIASVVVVGWIARKITRSAAWAYVAAVAYGFALPAIIVSCEVRSYMLSSFFILLSFAFLLEIAAPECPERALWVRAGFTATAILACLSHYYAFFYCGAAIMLLLARMVRRIYRRFRVSWLAEAGTIVPVVAVIGALYGTHAGALAQIQSHLLPYYYDPHSTETLFSFLLRNWTNLVNLFLPWQIRSNFGALCILAVFLFGACALLVKFVRRGDESAMPASWTVLITAAMLGEVVVSAVAGKYPFGGDLRQQFLLFPFFVLCAALLADRFTAAVPVRGHMALSAAAGVAILAVWVVRFQQYPKVSQNVLARRIQAFDRLEPDPAAVYLDQYNLITFFIYHHDWRWSFLKLRNAPPGIDVYRISRGNRHMLVFRDKMEWNAKPDDASVYHKLAECLRAAGISEVSIFDALQTSPDPPFTTRAIQRKVLELASDSEVCAQRLAVSSEGWYGTFRNANCTALDLKPPRLSGTFDDSSDEIEYSGPWTHASFAAATEGTISFANNPAASAKLSFRGTEITWVYTKAYNRGWAAIRLDGRRQADIDLYSPKIVWQSKATFRDLPPGSHTFELIVAGRKDTVATDQFVDLDALIVR